MISENGFPRAQQATVDICMTCNIPYMYNLVCSNVCTYAVLSLPFY